MAARQTIELLDGLFRLGILFLSAKEITGILLAEWLVIVIKECAFRQRFVWREGRLEFSLIYRDCT